MDQDAPTGSGARPFDDRRKAVEDKFRRETRFILRKERMEKAIDIVHHLEDASAAWSDPLAWGSQANPEAANCLARPAKLVCIWRELKPV